MNLKITVAILVLLCTAVTVKATVYEVVNSGLYSDPLTWKGGAKPSARITSLDKIYIGYAFVLTLDSNVEFKDLSELIMWGGAAIKSKGSESLTMGPNVHMSGVYANSIHVARFNMYGGLGNNYEGNITTDDLFLYDKAQFTGNRLNINVKSTMRLVDGTATFSACKLTFDTSNNKKATIIFEGGELALVNSVVVNLSIPYNVRYTTSAYNEIKGPLISSDGLHNLEVYAGAGNSLDIGSFEFSGDLILGSGTLNVKKGATVTMGYYGHITNVSGAVELDGCNLVVHSKETDAGELKMMPGSALDSIVMAAGLTTILYLGTDVKVNKYLRLMIGDIHTQDNELILTPGAVIAGGEQESNVKSDSAGGLLQEVGGTEVRFPVGTADNYAPVTVKNNSGTKNMVSVRVNNGVLRNGSTGADISQHQPMVNVTWTIGGNAATPDMDIAAWWNAAMEKHSFDRSNAYLSHYDTDWDSLAASSAAAQPLGLYSLERGNINAYGSYAVFDSSTRVSITEIDEKTAAINIYPNPVQDRLHINYTGQVHIYNIQGQEVIKHTVSNSAIDVSSLPAGNYQLVLYGYRKYTAQFVKQ